MAQSERGAAGEAMRGPRTQTSDRSETERAGPTRRVRRGAGGPEAVGAASGGGGGERRSPAASVTNQRARFCEGQQRE
ncbi:unnamed protein product [Lampetra planeri]